MFSPLGKQQEHRLLPVECQQEPLFPEGGKSRNGAARPSMTRSSLLALDTVLLKKTS